MEWFDNQDNKLLMISKPSDLVAILNSAANAHGVMSSEYYLHSEEPGKIVISNARPYVYENLSLKKYIAPKNNNARIKSLVSILKGNINILHNDDPDAALNADKKAFQLNRCFHNSNLIYSLAEHLARINYISVTYPVQIVMGYISRLIPYGTQIANAVNLLHSVWLHDWHIWNYVDNLLIDSTIFKNGNLIPPDVSIISWGTSEDHVYVCPPQGTEYWGIAFENTDEFNTIFEQAIGFKK